MPSKCSPFALQKESFLFLLLIVPSVKGAKGVHSGDFAGFISGVLASLHAVIAEAAAQAVLALAVACVQLDERLRVGCIVGCYAALLPQAYVGVVLGRQRHKQIVGASHEVFVLAMVAVGMQHGHYGVDNEQVDGCRREMLGIAARCVAEGVVGLPVGADGGLQRLAHLGERDACGDTAQVGIARAV